MFNYEKLIQTIQLLDKLDPNDYYDAEYEVLIDVLSENVDDTINYFEKCTAKELTWINCVFDDVIERTQSAKLLLAMHNVVNRLGNHPDAIEYPIKENMKFSDGALKDEAWIEFEKLMKENS